MLRYRIIVVIVCFVGIFCGGMFVCVIGEVGGRKKINSGESEGG